MFTLLSFIVVLTETKSPSKANAETEHLKAMESLRTDNEQKIKEMKDKHEKDLIDLMTSTQEEVTKVTVTTTSKVKVPTEGDQNGGGGGEAGVVEAGREVSEARDELRNTFSRHEQLLEQLKKDHLQELETGTVSLKEELLEESKRKFEEATGKLDTVHQSEMEELRKELDKKYQDQIHFLEEELERSNDDTEKALHEMRDKYEREITTLRDAARRHAPGDVVERDDPGGGGGGGGGDLTRLSQQHEEELQELEQEHQQKLGLVEKFHAEAVEKLKLEAEQRLASELEQLHEQLEHEKQEEVRKVIGPLEQQITELRLRLEDSEGRDTRDGGEEEELERRMDQISRLSELLADRGEELSKAEEHIGELEKKLTDQKEDYDLMVARWEAEDRGDGNRHRLVQGDMEQLSQERDTLQQANDRLLQILSDTVKANLVSEERINRRLAGLVAEGGRLSSASGTSHRESGVGSDRPESSSLASGAHKGEDETLETSAASMFSDEGLDLSQRVNESIFAGPELDPDGEEVIIDAGHRLQHAVDRLLDMIVASTRQLHDAQSTQRDLVASLTSRSEESQSLGVQVEDLKLRLKEENEAKAFLAVELNKAEGLVQGYSDEKRQLEDALTTLEEKKEELIIDLERTQARLNDLEDNESEVMARENALERQQLSLEQSLNEEDQVETVTMATEVVAKDAGLTQSPPLPRDTEGLLHEVQKLMEEKRDIQRQAEKDRETYEGSRQELEQMVEEQQITFEDQLEQKKAELDDMQHKVDVLEKKSKSNNLFLEEQTLEREQEREEFQREVTRLKAMIKDKEKSENAEHRLHREPYEDEEFTYDELRDWVAELEDQLAERVNLHSQALIRKEEVERELANQEANVKSLQEMIRQLEEELEAKTIEEHQVREKMEKLEADLMRQQEAREELTVELKKSVPQDELKRLVGDLESQLQTIQKSERLASEKVHQKDEELRNMKTMEEELQHDKTSLQQQVSSQLNELSTLRSQMEEMKLNAARQDSANAAQDELRQLLRDEQNALENKTREIHDLESQLDAVRRELLDKTELVQQLEAQLEVSETERRHQLAENTRRTAQLNDENKALQIEIKSLREKVESTPMPVLNQALLDEKNEEIDYLTEQLARLEEQLANSSAQHEVDRLTKEVEERTEELKTQHVHIDKLQEELEKMRDSAELMAAVKEADAEKDRKLVAKIKEKEERIQQLETLVTEGQEDLAEVETRSERQVKELRNHLQQKDFDMAKMQEDYETQREADLHSLQETIRERENTIDDMSSQVESLQHEISGLRDFQAKLQEDFDTVQTMLEEKQREIESLSREIKPQTDNVSAELKRQHEREVLTLQKDLRTKQATIEDREEQLYTLQDKVQHVESLTRDVEELREALDIKDRLLVESQDENRTLEDRIRLLEADAGDGTNSRLHQQIQEQETLIERLQDELSLSHSHLKARQDEFTRALEELEAQQAPPPPAPPAPQPQQNLEELRHALREQLRQEYEQRLHHKMVELESTHQEQVAALRDQFEDERRTLREETRREMEKRHSEELNRLVLQHEEELSRLRHAIDLSDDDSVLEAGRRLHAEIERSERIDSRIYNQMALRPSGVGRAASPADDTTSRLQHILNKIEAQGVRLLSLSEMESLRRHVQQSTGASPTNTTALQQAWDAEKHALLSAVQSLKDLLAQTQHARGAAKDDDSEADWRADLLRAICYVFAKERDGLLAELRTHVVTHGNQDPSAIQHLEQKMKEMDIQHASAMKQIFSADRQSMLAEIRDLRAHLSVLRLEKQDERAKLAEQLATMEEQFTKRERHLKRQLELMEYKIQQEKVMADDLRSSLEIEKSRSMELSSQLSREKNSGADLQSDFVDAQTQLAKLKDAYEREQARLVSASSALEEERQKTASLTEALTVEQMSANQVSEQLRAEQLRSKQQLDRSKQLNEQLSVETQAHNEEKLRREIESDKEQLSEANSTLERERMTGNSLRRELDMERDQHRTTERQYKSKVTELRATAETEKARNDELNTALQRERQLNAQLRESLDEERGSKDDMSVRERAAIADLQAMLDLERSKLLDLQRALEKERRKVSSLNATLDHEQARAQDSLEVERSACRQLKLNIESLQAQKSELAGQLTFCEEKVHALEADRARLQDSMQAAKEQCRHLEAKTEAERTNQREEKRRLVREFDQDRQKQYDAELEINRLRQKATELELQLTECQQNERAAREELDLERVKASLAPPQPEQFAGRLSPGVSDDRMEFYKRQLETLRQRLHVIVNRHQEELARMLRNQFGAAVPSSTESLDTASKPELDSISRILREILSELQQVHGVITHDSEGGSHTSPKAEAAEDRLSAERVAWSEERGALTLKLHGAEKEINNIKNKLRKTEIQLEREREKYITPTQTAGSVDKEKMQRLYGKYLRAESFRKALVYQKKYLLLLLGGFQDCEEQTLSEIAKMGVYPTAEDVARRTRHPRPYSRFRSTVRVVIAVSRMKYLVKKWQRATRVGSSAVTGSTATHNGTSSYVPTSSGFAQPRRHYPAPAPTTPSARLTNGQVGAGEAAYLRASPVGARSRLHTTPPTRDLSAEINTAHHAAHRSNRSASAASARRQLLHDDEYDYDDESDAGSGQDNSLDDYISRLEHIQARLSTVNPAGSPSYFVR